MEKVTQQLQPRSKLKIKVTPQILREAADRIEAEYKNNCLPHQEVELDFTRSVTLIFEPESSVSTFRGVCNVETASVAMLEHNREDA